MLVAGSGTVVVRIVDLDKHKLPADCYVFKHSTRCPTSTAAAAVVRGLDLDLPLFWVNVIEQRELSDWVARKLGVQHESPQLIELRHGVVKRVLSHYDVSRARIEPRSR